MRRHTACLVLGFALALIGLGCGQSMPPSGTSAARTPSISQLTASPTTLSSAATASTDPALAARWLAFAKGPENVSSDIYVGRADGSGVRRVTNGPGFRYNPAWSPDGTRILYRVEGPANTPADPARDGIWVVNEDGSNDHSISAISGIVGAGQSQPWSPDGQRIAMSGAHRGGQLRIWVMNADGKDARPLTPETYEAQYPAWSPDGKTIAFGAVIEGGFRIFAVDADGANLRQVTDGPQDNWPSWSPDGGHMIFGRGGGLAVMRSDGSDVRVLTDEVGVPAAWAPGPEIIANCQLDNSAIGVCIVGSDGAQTNVLGGLDAGFPSWKP